MDNRTAAILLASLMERIERDQTIGSVSSLERQALQLAVHALSNGAEATSPTPPLPSPHTPAPAAKPSEGESTTSPPAASPPMSTVDETPSAPKPPQLPKVTLVLDSIERESPSDADVLMCLDFGTAMSKAFAAIHPDGQIELELGATAGGTGYALPSSMFIGDDEKVYFGGEAIDMSQRLEHSKRKRLDSIKSWFSLRRDLNRNIDTTPLDKAQNPTQFDMTQGDMIRIYLAYLTDVTGIALGQHEGRDPAISRYVKRRFARPCWPDAVQAEWADKLMRTMLAQAQILADTFRGQWAGGIEVARLKAAVEEVKALGKAPDYLIDAGVPEPVAVAAGAIEDSENLRDAFMVVDVGAGTTDFGLFVSTRTAEDGKTRVFQVPASIHGLMQAGDKVDAMLRIFITRKESIDDTDTLGSEVTADLVRRIRGLKEVLFSTGQLEYALSDSTVGSLTKDEFLADPTVQRFAAAVEKGFVDALQLVDESWLKWLSMESVHLNVVLTGGSSRLDMMEALTRGPIDVKGYKILRKRVDPKPYWMDDAPDELVAVYPQLAVAIGGTAEEMPKTVNAPDVFGGGGRSTYVAGRLQITGS